MKGGPPKAMGLVFSIKQTGVPLGALIGGLVLPLIIAAGGWRSAVLSILAVCLLMSMGLQFWRNKFDDERDAARRITPNRSVGSLKTFFNTPAAFRLACCSFFLCAMQLCVMSYLVSFVTHSFEMALAAAGLLMSIAHASGIVGGIGWGWLIDTAITARVVLIFLALAMGGIAVALGLLPNDTPWSLIALVVAVLGATTIGWNGVFLAEVARIAPRRNVGAVTGAALFLAYFGVVVGPPIFSVVLSVTQSYATSFAVISTSVVIGGVLLL